MGIKTQRILRLKRHPLFSNEVFPRWLSAVLKSITALFIFFILVIIASRIQVKRKTNEIMVKNEALQISEKRYRGLFEDSPVSLWEEDFSDIKKHINRLRDSGITDLRSYFKDHPEAVRRCRELDLYETSKTGKLFLKLFITPCKTRGYEQNEFLVHIIDITERKQAEKELYRANRALKTFSECNQAVVRARKEPHLLHEICRIIVNIGGYRLAWVGFVRQDEAKTVQPVAQAGYEEGYLDKLNITWADTERGRGPTGTAGGTG